MYIFYLCDIIELIFTETAHYTDSHNLSSQHSFHG